MKYAVAALIVFLGVAVAATSPQQVLPKLHRVPITGIGGPDRNEQWIMPGKCFRLDDYKLNPLVSINHSNDVTMIVGEVVSFDIIDGWMYAYIDFIDRPANWEGSWLPDLAETLFDAGVLGVSIMADEVERHSLTVEESTRFPDASYIVDSCRLLDLSVVAIPAFAEAVPTNRL